MPTQIDWPQKLLVTDEVIDTWFIAAVGKNMIDPLCLSFTTTAQRAKALDDAGLIRLSRDTTKTED